MVSIEHTEFDYIKKKIKNKINVHFSRLLVHPQTIYNPLLLTPGLFGRSCGQESLFISLKSLSLTLLIDTSIITSSQLT